MALSEHEQRALDQIERALAAQYPGLHRLLGRSRPSHPWRWAALAIALYAVAVTVLWLGAIHVDLPLLVVGGLVGLPVPFVLAHAMAVRSDAAPTARSRPVPPHPEECA